MLAGSFLVDWCGFARLPVVLSSFAVQLDGRKFELKLRSLSLHIPVVFSMQFHTSWAQAYIYPWLVFTYRRIRVVVQLLAQPLPSKRARPRTFK